ncbi:IclR family transcriptional regulator [Terrarubrum flagellatum]|uniref:IclR family transcriptional regulator n=1 Tax=Terrirubrum flagellatum TaxID=2895980 RepID=UPI0031456EFC
MTTLASAAEVLRCFSLDRPYLTVTSTSTLLGTPKSTASRLLRSMMEAGYLETIGASKKYRPAALLYEVGRLYRDASSLTVRAHEVVARVCAQTGHTGYVSRRQGLDIVAVTDIPGTNALRVASSIGRRLEAFASATGRTLLARLSDEAVRQLYSAPLIPPSPTAPQNLDELLSRLAMVRRVGYAESNDESNRGVGALAVGVGDPETAEEVSLCISFPAAMITAEERRTIIGALRAGAAEIAAITRDPLFVHDPDVREPSMSAMAPISVSSRRVMA